MPGHAVLVFVEGEQQGQRVLLPGAPVVLGRSPAAGVVLKEQYVSREHTRLTLTAEGWLLQNLSSNGTEINGKSYKSEKKQVLLDTGDIIGVGKETLILFVAGGDDADAAVAKYKAKHPSKAARKTIAAEGGATGNAAVTAERSGGKAELSSAPAQATAPVTGLLKRKGKLVKYAPYIGLYVLAMVGLVLFLNSLDGPDKVVSAKLERLSEGEIRTILTSPLQKSSNDVRAATELKQAQTRFENRRFHHGDVYRCVKHYRLYLAHKASPGFDNSNDEQSFLKATNELVADVVTAYENAWKKEQGRDWAGSRQEYERLLTLVPEDDTTDQVHQQLILNVRGHLAYVRGNMKKKR